MKILSILLVALVTIAFATGCGKTDRATLKVEFIGSGTTVLVSGDTLHAKGDTLMLGYNYLSTRWEISGAAAKFDHDTVVARKYIYRRGVVRGVVPLQ